MSEKVTPSPELRVVSMHRMTVADFRRFRAWESWLLITLASAYQLGNLGQPLPKNRIEEAQNTLYALHSGLLELASREGGGNVGATAPPLPKVWPDHFPIARRSG